jgi:hypothetical protein
MNAARVDPSAGAVLDTDIFRMRSVIMAKLRHLAILTHQPEKLADFYKKVFELNEMYRTKNGSVHLSDGEVNLAS